MEYRVAGPPGTGKTTWITRQVRRALGKYDPHEIYAVSFTRAAAEELTSRSLEIPKRNVGTIHSICYQFMDREAIAEVDKDLLREWNEQHGGLYQLARDSDEIDGNKKSTPLDAWNLARCTLQEGRAGDRRFVESWESFKESRGVIDFTDMLLSAPDRLPACKVLFVDEAQDLNPLQWKIVRQWGQYAEEFIVVGDDDQMLYEFTGARADEFVSPLPSEQCMTLKRSYRLPSAIHGHSMAWIKQIDPGFRIEKEFEPDCEGGSVDRVDANFKMADDLLVPIVKAAENGTVMILTTCAYMLKNFIEVFRENGIPYFNPYRKARGDWNPMGRGVARDKVLCFDDLHRSMIGQANYLNDAATWEKVASMLKTGPALKYGAKKRLREIVADKKPFLHVDADLYFSEETKTAIKGQNWPWLLDNISNRDKRSCGYAAHVAMINGVDALRGNPNIILGTIHSVKGGEADTVYLFPDMSYNGFYAMMDQGDPGRYNAIRQFYVGMTRAKKRLVLGEAATPRYLTEF